MDLHVCAWILQRQNCNKMNGTDWLESVCRLEFLKDAVLYSDFMCDRCKAVELSCDCFEKCHSRNGFQSTACLNRNLNYFSKKPKSNMLGKYSLLPVKTTCISNWCTSNKLSAQKRRLHRYDLKNWTGGIDLNIFSKSVMPRQIYPTPM